MGRTISGLFVALFQSPFMTQLQNIMRLLFWELSDVESDFLFVCAEHQKGTSPLSIRFLFFILGMAAEQKV